MPPAIPLLPDCRFVTLTIAFKGSSELTIAEPWKALGIPGTSLEKKVLAPPTGIVKLVVYLTLLAESYKSTMTLDMPVPMFWRVCPE